MAPAPLARSALELHDTTLRYMKFVCDACGARYVIDDSRLKPGRALRIRCKRCSHVITVAAPDSTALGNLPERRATGRLTAFRKSSAPATPSSEPKSWHFARNGESFGPYTETELIARFNRGDLGDEAFVWQPGFSAWKPASDIKAFASAIKEAISRKVRQGPATQRLSAADISRPAEDDAAEKTRVHRLDDLQKDIDDHLARTRDKDKKKAPVARPATTRKPTAPDPAAKRAAEAAEAERALADKHAKELREKAEQARVAAQQARQVERQAAEAEARAADSEARAAEEAAREREEAERLAAEHDARARAAAEARSREEKKRRRTGMLQAPRPTTRSSLPAIGSALPSPPARPSTALPAIGTPTDREPEDDALARDADPTGFDADQAAEEVAGREADRPASPAMDAAPGSAPEVDEASPETGEVTEPEDLEAAAAEAELDELEDEDTPASGNWITAPPDRAARKAPPKRDTSAIRAQSLLADFDELDAADPESGIEMWPDADELPPPPPPPPKKRTPVWIGVGAAAFVVLALIMVGIGTSSSGSGDRAGLGEDGSLTVESPHERRRRTQNRMAALQRAERTVNTAWTRAGAQAAAERARIGTARASAAARRAEGGSPGTATRTESGRAPSLMEQIAARSEQQGGQDSGLGRPGGRLPTRAEQMEMAGGPGLPSLGGSGPSFGGSSISGPERVMPQGTGARGPSADHFRAGFDQFVRPAIQRCNQRHMGEAGELLTGRIVLRFVIRPNGHVASMTPTDRSFRDTPFFRCLSGESSRWRFDPFEGQDATVERSYVLQ